ncbi:hypothetical protein BJ878DRAFT_567484 [Calycina marina]|uniref:Uncharacterized protein n=1 Tax=Calycina marina TaxID=1763456 RepID=A0A9P7Z3B4_9HELO|nr:hypothetical protein BJ878DRAFT_567484 [Calycina marina]
MADNLRSSAAGQNPSFATDVSKEEAILGDKAVGGMDDDKGHVAHVKSGLKAAMSNDNNSEKAKAAAEEKLDTLNKKS